MKFEQIEQVLEVVKTGTFSQAARNLYMSQPNLSLSIKQLEEELNCPLFIRSSDGVLLTEEGKYIIEHMQLIHSNFCSLKDYSRCKEPKRLSLRVAMTSLNRAAPCFVDITRKYMKSPVNFSFQTYQGVNEVIERIVTCEADIGIIGIMEPYIRSTLSKLKNNHIEYHYIARNLPYAAVGPENPWYDAKESVCMDDLKTQTLATFSSSPEAPSTSLFDLSKIKLNPYGQVFVNNSNLFYSMIQDTNVIGLITCSKEAFYRPQNKWRDLKLIPITDYPFYVDFWWIKLRRLAVTEVEEELIEMLTEVF